MSESGLKVTKKQSLSILSGSHINQLNNASSNSSVTNNKESPTKPIRERIISESTGLVKFALGGRSNNLRGEEEQDQKSTKGSVWDSSKENHHGLPIYIPVNKESKEGEEGEERNEESANHDQLNQAEDIQDDRSNVILYKIASEQRQLLELREQVKFHEAELKRLEAEYKDMVINSGNDVGTMSQVSQVTNTAIRQITKKASSLAMKNMNSRMNDISAISSNSSSSGGNTNSISNNNSNNSMHQRGHMYSDASSSTSSSNNNLQFNAQTTVENIKNDITKTFNELNLKQDLTNTLNEIKNNFNHSNNELQSNQLFKKFLAPSNKLKEDFSSKFNTFFKIPNQQQTNSQHVQPNEEEFMDKEELREMLNESFNYSDCHFLEEESRSRRGSPMKNNHMNSRLLEDLEEEEEDDDDDYGAECHPNSYLAGDSSFEDDYGSEPTQLKL